MKGINVKKIAAFAGAAVLFGSAFAVADVVYGSTQLVDQNGQPTVKIYVGSTAAISDGVAAANIAAKIANEAYKSSTLTASVSGTPTVTCGTGSGAGACSIVESSKKVTLEVNVPGSIAGTHTFKTLITDTIDRTLQNRNTTRSEDNYTATLTATDTAGAITSPLRAVETDTTKGKWLYKIGAGQFSGFADNAMVDNQATATTYTEEQSFWIGSQINAVAYDSSSSIRDVAVNKLAAMAYSTKFTGNDFGIPVCTGDLATNDTTNWASCSSDSNSRTDRHRLTLKFMGSDWIVSEMTNPSAATQTSSTSVAAGGQIKLAKEAKYGIINVGQVLDAGVFKVRLSDISVATGASNTHPAIIDILDANEAVVGQVQVDPGSTYTFTQSGTGQTVKIHVYKTAPGFTLNAKWAEMAIYNDEITLKDGSRYNLVSSTDVDKDFKVSLLWKNKDYTGLGTDSNVSDSLREIVVHNIDGFADKTKAGDVINFIKSAPTYKLTYQGVDLTDDDYVPLTFSGLSSDTYRIATTDGDVVCGASSTADLAYTAKLVEIRTGGAQLLGGTGDALSGDYLFEKVLIDPIGMAASLTAYNGSATLQSGAKNVTAVTANVSKTVTGFTLVGAAGTNLTGSTSNITAFTNASVLSATAFNASSTGAAGLNGWVYIPAAYVNATNYTLVDLPSTYYFVGAVGTDLSATSNIPGFSAATIYNATAFNVTGTINGSNAGWVNIPASANLASSLSINGTQNQAIAPANYAPKVFYKVSGRDCYNWNNLTYVTTTPAVVTNSIKLDAAGDNSAAQGRIYLEQLYTLALGTGNIVLAEDAGYFGLTSNNAVYTHVPMIANNTAYQTIRFKSEDSSTQQVWYTKLDTTNTTYEPTLVTERGSKVLSVGTSDASIKVAKKLGMPTFQFATSDTSSSSSGEEYIMGVGESKVFGGVTVKVKAVDMNGGSCSVVLGPNGVPACTAGSINAVISPDNAASVEATQPYKLTSNLVAKDTDGASSGAAILVGGPMVNTMTRDALQESAVDFNTDSVVVREIGNKIVVAGKSAADTMAAAEQFIAGVQRQ